MYGSSTARWTTKACVEKTRNDVEKTRNAVDVLARNDPGGATLALELARRIWGVHVNVVRGLAQWATTWNAQASTLPQGTGLSAVVNTNGSLAVTLSGTSSLALDAVTVPSNDVPNMAVYFTAALGTSPTVAVSGTLTDQYGDILSQNGGSCQFTSAPPPGGGGPK